MHGLDLQKHFFFFEGEGSQSLPKALLDYLARPVALPKGQGRDPGWTPDELSLDLRLLLAVMLSPKKKKKKSIQDQAVALNMWTTVPSRRSPKKGGLCSHNLCIHAAQEFKCKSTCQTYFFTVINISLIFLFVSSLFE